MAPDESLMGFLERVALVSDVDNLDQTQDAVTLTTLHQAKGLEFPVVFMVGMEEGLLPHARSLDDPAEMEEGAPPLLRGDHPGGGAALSCPGLPTYGHGRRNAQHALPFPEGHSQGAHCEASADSDWTPRYVGTK